MEGGGGGRGRRFLPSPVAGWVQCGVGTFLCFRCSDADGQSHGNGADGVPKL